MGEGKHTREGVTDPVVHGMAWKPLPGGHHLLVRNLQLADVVPRIGRDGEINHHVAPPAPACAGIKSKAGHEWWGGMQGTTEQYAYALTAHR